MSRRGRNSPLPENMPSREKKPKKSGMNEPKVEFNYNREENTKRHHTDEYENDVLVLRRGATFDLGLTFHSLSFHEIQQPVLRFGIAREQKIPTRTVWETKVVKENPDECSINVRITIPVNAAVGRFKVEVVVPNHSKHPLEQSGELIVLFNPWNKDDEVYFADEDGRYEYVLNDYGLVYAGESYRGPYPRGWIFGQFETDVLDCVLYLLESDRRIKKKPLKSLLMRSSAVWVARILSAMINSQDDDGVLVGNWSGEYDKPEGSKSPSEWNGSVAILQEHYRTKEPVRYGQCWVFSGVLTTALRAIGIPARSITNYNSAHDTDNTMTIDKFIDEEGNDVEDLNNDSTWNFHVWNEIWTKRKDLPGNKYDGWQAVDSTPQEESSKLYQCGPAPLAAIKDGEVYAGFDTGFIFSEVNADRVTWVVKRVGKYYIIQKVSKQWKTGIGRNISTKMVGSYKRNDITHLYKYPEHSEKEREAFATAYSFGDAATDWAVGHLNVEEEGNELDLELSTKEEILHLGKSITCLMNVKNKSKENITVNLTGVISSMQYTGNVRSLVKRQTESNVKIGAGKDLVKEIQLRADDYVDKLIDLNFLKFVLVAKVLETNKVYVDETSFKVINQDTIKIKFDESPLQVGKEAEVEVTFTNPLSITLSYIKITIEGAGLEYSKKKVYRKSLKPDGTQTAKFSFTPRKPGKRTLLVDVDTTQVKDFKAYAEVEVLPREA